MSNTRYFKWFNFIFVCLPVSGLILSSCGSHKKANITISASGNQLIYDDTKSQYLDINVTFQNMQSQNVAVVGHFFDSEIAWSDVLQFSPAAFNNTTKLIFNPAFTFADPTPLTFIFYVTANRTQSNELTINIVKGEAPLASLFSRFKNADDPIVLGSSTSNISTPSSRTVRHYATNPSYNDQAASAGIEPDDLSQSAITNNHFSYIVDHAIKGEYY
jgi:hypothetical protein